MIRVGIVGGAGYAAGELIRVLLNHPQADVVFAQSESNAGNRLADVHCGLEGETDLCFSSEPRLDEIDVLFLCLGHGRSREWLEMHRLPEGVKVIDFAQDFRLSSAEPVRGEKWVYGLPETNKAKIREAHYVANPGCFATCTELALLPLARAGLLQGVVSINALTGSTGAGQKPTSTTHFSWRSGNMSVYKAFRHQHLAEIKETLLSLPPTGGTEGGLTPSLPPTGGTEGGLTPFELDFLPYRGDWTRGIFLTVVMRGASESVDYAKLYTDFYKDEPFSHYTERQLDLKQVVGTNKFLCHADLINGRLLVCAAIDNLLKGAAGQAVQNMNLMFGMGETAGLNLKATAF